jgi:hypothetical protein
MGVVFRNIEDRDGETLAEPRAGSSVPREKPFIRLGSSKRVVTFDPLPYVQDDLYIDDGDLANLFSDNNLEQDPPECENPEDNGGRTVRILSII